MNRAAYIEFEAVYHDGHVERFSIDADTLGRGDYIARMIARERQSDGELSAGRIVDVKRAALP